MLVGRVHGRPHLRIMDVRAKAFICPGLRVPDSQVLESGRPPGWPLDWIEIGDECVKSRFSGDGGRFGQKHRKSCVLDPLLTYSTSDPQNWCGFWPTFDLFLWFGLLVLLGPLLFLNSKLNFRSPECHSRLITVDDLPTFSWPMCSSSIWPFAKDQNTSRKRAPITLSMSLSETNRLRKPWWRRTVAPLRNYTPRTRRTISDLSLFARGVEAMSNSWQNNHKTTRNKTQQNHNRKIWATDTCSAATIQQQPNPQHNQQKTTWSETPQQPPSFKSVPVTRDANAWTRISRTKWKWVCDTAVFKDTPTMGSAYCSKGVKHAHASNALSNVLPPRVARALLNYERHRR